MRKPMLSLGSWAFSFGPFADHPWSFEKFCVYCADAGYDGVEINGFRPHPHPDDFATSARRRELKRFLDGLGLGVSGYAPDFTTVPPTRVPAKKYVAVATNCLDFMHDLDVRILRVDTVTPPGPLEPSEYESQFANLVGTWQATAELCRQSGVTLVWEYEPGFWLNKPSEVLRLIQAINHPSFKVLFDTSHSYMGAVAAARHVGSKEVLAGGLEQYARLLSPHVGHLHLIDSDGTLHNNETSTHAPFGSGLVAFRPVLEALGPALDAL